jgi:hypothetical protein
VTVQSPLVVGVHAPVAPPVVPVEDSLNTAIAVYIDVTPNSDWVRVTTPVLLEAAGLLPPPLLSLLEPLLLLLDPPSPPLIGLFVDVSLVVLHAANASTATNPVNPP